MIASAEGVDAEDGVSLMYRGRLRAHSKRKQVLELILRLASGDLRKAITYLQTAQRLHSASNPPTPITSMSSTPVLLIFSTIT
jgi:replication factor C subunit 2/4